MRLEKSNKVIEDVRRALGRDYPLTAPPKPPVIPEPLTRLVHTEIGLPELFARRAAENKMDVEAVRVELLPQRLLEFLNSKQITSAAVPISSFLAQVGVLEALRSADLRVGRWDQISLDELFDYGCGITDVYAAVAETGSLVVKSSATHGRALSLVPPVHIAIVEPKNFIPDLVDLFAKLSAESAGTGTVLISGPSKTADIEMNLVQGVHGPGVVKVFVL
jgi:L-lactate utilization protein LutC